MIKTKQRFSQHRLYTLDQIEHLSGGKATYNAYHGLYSVTDRLGDFSQYDFAGDPGRLKLVAIDGESLEAK